MKSKFQPIYVLFFSLFIAFTFLNYSNNPPNGKTGAPGESTCGSCHSSNNPNGYVGSLQIINFPSTIVPNTVYNLQAVINYTAGTPSRAGFQSTILDSNNFTAGTITPTDANTTTQTQPWNGGKEYVEHNPALFFGGNTSVTYTFDWLSPNAPNGEIITVYTSGIIADGANTTGDLVITNSISGTVMGSGGNAPTATASSSPISCFGGNNGSASASGTGGTPGYNYLWSNGGNTNTIGGLIAGTYTVTVTDNAGGTASATTVVTQPNSPTSVTITNSSNPSCNGSNNGSATANGSGGTPNYTYMWSNGNNGSTISNLGSGTYTVTVTDNNQCTSSQTISLTEPNLVIANPTSSSACDQGNGTATFDLNSLDNNVNGGTSNSVSYFVDQNATIPVTSPFNTTPTTIFAVVNNGNCFSSPVSISLNVSNAISLAASQNNISCNGTTDGSATATPSGGAGNFTYLWSNNMSTPTISNLTAGTYTVTVFDNNQCTNSTTVTITEPSPLQLSVGNQTNTNISCNGSADGVAECVPFNGTLPYNFIWSNGSVTPIVNLPAGIYTVTVTDANNCSETLSYTITEPDAIIANASSTDETAANANDGTATANPTGGVGNYTFVWNNNVMTQTISNLPPGNYTVTVTDNNGCTDTQTVNVAPINCAITVTLTSMDASCANTNDGSATATATGGSSQYTYNWSTGQSGMTISNLAPGTYTVTVSDSNNCSAPEEIIIGVSDAILPTIVTQIANVFLDANGVAIVTSNMVDNGSSDNCGIQSLTVSPNTFSCDDLGSQPITLTVTDVNGNVATENTFVAVLDTIPPTSNCVFNPTVDDCTGFLIYELPTFVDNCVGVSFEIVGPQSGTIIPTGTTTIDFIITDGSGNITTCSEVIIHNPPLSVDIVGTDVFCFGENTGSAIANATGSNPGFTYQWNTGDTTQQIDNLPAGDYNVVVTDNLGCDTNVGITINEPSEIIVTDIAVTDESSPGQSDGSIGLIVSGGSPPYSFNPNPTNLPGGNYIIEITDANGCSISTAEITVGTMVSNENVLLEKEIQLYPNPSSGQVYLDFTLPQSMEVMVKLFDATGKFLWERPAESISQKEIELEVSDLTSGMYFVQIQADENILMKRFILQKE